MKSIWLLMAFSILFLYFPQTAVRADDVPLALRSQVETAKGSDRFHQVIRQEAWAAAETAVVAHCRGGMPYSRLNSRLNWEGLP